MWTLQISSAFTFFALCAAVSGCAVATETDDAASGDSGAGTGGNLLGTGGAGTGGAGTGGAGTGGAGTGGAGTGGAGTGGVGTGGAGTGGAKGDPTFDGDCADAPLFTTWQTSAGATGDRVVFQCGKSQAACEGLVVGEYALFECNQTHVGNCATQAPSDGSSWTFVGECVEATGMGGATQ